MQEFRIRKDGFKEVRKKMLTVLIPLTIIMVGLFIAASVMKTGAKMEDMPVLAITILAVLAITSFSMFRSIKRQKAKFDSYLLTITNNMVSREQDNTPVIAIYFNEVKQIVKHRNNWFTIKSNNGDDVILIPAQIENYTELETALSAIRPITTQHAKDRLQKLRGLLALAAVGLWICVLTLDNKIIVGLGGMTLIVLMTWSFFKIRKSRNADYRSKKRAWLVIIALLAIIAIMIMKLNK